MTRGLASRLRWVYVGLVLVAASLAALPADAENAVLWSALRGGEHVVLMRHAVAPGTGDPAGFELDDCSTQRNLSERGREQARATGERFRANGVTDAAVYSSQWCRCLETARLLDRALRRSCGETAAHPRSLQERYLAANVVHGASPRKAMDTELKNRLLPVKSDRFAPHSSPLRPTCPSVMDAVS